MYELFGAAGFVLMMSENAHGAESSLCTSRFSLVSPVPTECLEPIETDRPHRTDTPHTLDAGHVRVEAGFEYARGAKRDDDAVSVFSNEYTLGLATNWGILRGWDVQLLHVLASLPRTGSVAWGNELLVRSKLLLLSGDLSFSVVPAIVAPLARAARVGAGGFVFAGAELPWQTEVELNIGALALREHGAETFGRFVVTSAVTKKIQGPLSLFVELYNESAPWSGSFDSGLLLRISRDWQLDAGAYCRLHGDIPPITPYFGISTRL